MNLEDRDDMPRLDEMQTKLACAMLHKAIFEIIHRAVGKALEGIMDIYKAMEAKYPLADNAKVEIGSGVAAPPFVESLALYLARTLEMVKNRETELIELIYALNIDTKKWVQRHCPEIHEKLVEIEREADPLFDHKSEEIKAEMNTALEAFAEIERKVKEAIARKQNRAQNN